MRGHKNPIGKDSFFGPYTVHVHAPGWRMYMYMVGMFVTDNGSGMSGEGAGHILPASGAMQPASKVKWAHGVGSRGRSKEARKNCI